MYQIAESNCTFFNLKCYALPNKYDIFTKSVIRKMRIKYILKFVELKNMDKTIEIDDSTEKTIILDSSKEENNTIDIIDSSSEEEQEHNGNFMKFSIN